MHGCAVEGCPAADRAEKEMAAEEIVDGPEDGFTAVPQPDGRAAHRHPAGVVEGAVEGIHHPHAGRGGQDAVFAAFLGQDGQGKALGEDFQDPRLGQLVGAELDVVGGLADDVQRAAGEVEQEAAGGAYGGFGGLQGGIEVEIGEGVGGVHGVSG